MTPCSSAAFRPAAHLHACAPRGWRGLAALALLAWACVQTAHAAAIPFGDAKVTLTAREQPIAGFLQDLFGIVGLPVSVSPSVKGPINGTFDGPAERVYANVARAFGLVAYYDGSVVYVSTAADVATRSLPVSRGEAERIVRAAAEMHLPDTRHVLRAGADGGLTVTGTRRFIEQIEELTRAQVAPRGARGPVGFKVFHLRYAWAQDTVVSFGGRKVVVPGMASLLRALITPSGRSAVHPNPGEQSLQPTVPSLREQAGDTAPRRYPTLGLPDGAGYDIVTAATGPAAAATPAAPAALPAAGADPQAPRIEANPQLNAVIVRDAPELMPQYEALIAELDVEPQPIEIEATIIDVNINRMRELGINWRWTNARTSVLFGRGDASDTNLAPLPPEQIAPTGRGGIISAVLGDGNRFIARINALQDQGAARVVSSPQVLTLSNVEAVFDNSSTFFVRVQGYQQVDLFSVSAGTSLRVTPHVFRDQGETRIKMLVQIEDGALGARQVDAIPVVERSSINTQALIGEGESLLVGGLTRESTDDNVTQVPLLGDIPLIGNLFKSRSDNSGRTERMFLISPRLVPGRRAVAQAAPGAGSAPPALAPVPAPADAPARDAASAPSPLDDLYRN